MTEAMNIFQPIPKKTLLEYTQNGFYLYQFCLALHIPLFRNVCEISNLSNDQKISLAGLWIIC